jgi:hypothetical protein
LAPSRCALSARVCPCVPELMYPSRTRGLLPSYKTSNALHRTGLAARPPRRGSAPRLTSGCNHGAP